jgi:hypothetical protein
MTKMKTLTTLSSLAAGALLLGTAGTVQASCTNCNQTDHEGDHEDFICSGYWGSGDSGSCYTEVHTDPNTCEEYHSCVTTVCEDQCTWGPGCDTNTPWEIWTLEDLGAYICYLHGWCPAE